MSSVTSWKHTMALHRLRKEGYSLRECSRIMSMSLNDVEELYLYNVQECPERRKLMRVDGDNYLKRRKFF